MNSGIYRITNKTTGKVYIGSSCNLSHRLYCHKQDAKNGVHHSLLFQRAWNKYGEDDFIFEVIEHCENSELIEKEQHYMDKYKCYIPKHGYNRSPSAGNTAGIKRSDETRKNISESKKGNTPWNKGLKGAQKWADDDPRRAKIAKRKGQKRDPAIGTKISATKKARGQKPTPEALEASAQKRRGKAGSQAQKDAINSLWSDPVKRDKIIAAQKAGRARAKANN